MAKKDQEKRDSKNVNRGGKAQVDQTKVNGAPAETKAEGETPNPTDPPVSPEEQPTEELPKAHAFVGTGEHCAMDGCGFDKDSMVHIVSDVSTPVVHVLTEEESKLMDDIERLKPSIQEGAIAQGLVMAKVRDIAKPLAQCYADWQKLNAGEEFYKFVTAFFPDFEHKSFREDQDKPSFNFIRNTVRKGQQIMIAEKRTAQLTEARDRNLEAEKPKILANRAKLIEEDVRKAVQTQILKDNPATPKEELEDLVEDKVAERVDEIHAKAAEQTERIVEEMRARPVKATTAPRKSPKGLQEETAQEICDYARQNALIEVETGELDSDFWNLCVYLMKKTTAARSDEYCNDTKEMIVKLNGELQEDEELETATK